MEREEVLIEIGLKIKELRQDKCLTQKDLAYSCDFEKSNISRIENGKCNMTIGTLLRICRVLDAKLIDVVDVES